MSEVREDRPVLVTGASGFIGQQLVTALAAQGRAVRALVRSAEAGRKALEAGAAELAEGDVLEPGSVARAAAGCALIYHLAGTYRGSPSELRATHVHGTANVLSGAEPGTRVVYVSSTSVYGWGRVWPADHDTLPQPASAYGRAKVEAEALVQAWDKGSGVVVRPTITYGVGDERGMLARVHRLLRSGVRVLPGNGENRIHLTHVDDLVAGLLLLGETGEGVFLLAGPEAAPARRIFGLLAEGAGLPPPRFAVPGPVLRPLAVGMESVWSALGRDGEAPLNRHAVDVATRDRAYDSTRAAEVLGWKPQVELEKGVPEVGRWLAARGDGSGEAPASSVASVAGNVRDGSLGFDWRAYVEDPDEGLGTVYERFALRDVLQEAITRTGSESVLHAPQFGMMGFPGLDTVFSAREGIRVGLLDFDAERLDAVVSEWRRLGLDPETHLVDGPDPTTWPERLDAEYDLVFSFAALWWFEDPWAVLAVQARWAGKGLLSCVPNKNVFMRLRARLWHQDLFERLNEQALDARAMTSAGEAAGLRAVETGLFDIPPFPDTSVPLAKVLRAALGRRNPPAEDAGDEGAWAWSILPYLRGEQPGLEKRIARLARWERYLPEPLAPGLAHHRYVLFEGAS